MARIYEGYILTKGRKMAFEIGPSPSKKKAHAEIKESYPKGRVFIVSSRPVKKRRR